MKHVLVIGGNGMLGSAIGTILSQHPGYTVSQTLRKGAKTHAGMSDCPIHYVDILNDAALWELIAKVRPNAVINCAGVIKQRPEAQDPLVMYSINTIFPHKLAQICKAFGTRMVHFSTDCVFTGEVGNYADSALSDAQDHYGRSKYAGEIGNEGHVVTLRTSIIGHEGRSRLALIDWFLNSTGPVKGFTNAIFTGFPTVEVGTILARHVLPNEDRSGLFNMSADPISKYDLLVKVREVYGKDIEIIGDDRVRIDRSLDSSLFRAQFDYTPPDWDSLIARMHNDKPEFGAK